MTRSSALACFVAAALLLVSAGARAQQPRTIAPGDWVRGEYLLKRVEGRVLGVDDGNIVIARDGRDEDTIVVPRKGLQSPVVSTGMRRNTLRGLGRGLLLGSLAGAVVGAVAIETCSGTWCFGPSSEGEAALAGAILGAGSGAILGTLIGATTVRREWQPVSVTVGIAPRAQLALTLSLRR